MHCHRSLFCSISAAGPVADVYHIKCGDLDRRRVWVDKKTRFAG